MKVTIAVKDLAEVLAKASGVVQGKVTIEALKYIKIDVYGSKATAYASDLGMTIIQQFEIKALTDAPNGAVSFLLPAKLIQEVLNSLAARETLTVDVTEKGLVVKSGKFTGKVPTLPVDQFPAVEVKPPTKFSIKNNVLKQLINRVEPAVPSKEGKFSIPVIHIEGTDTLLRAVATDGFRIAIADAPGIGVFSIDLPKTALPILKSLTGEEIQFSETETKYFFTSEKENVLVQKSPSIKFPPYQRALAALFLTDFTIASTELKTSLDLLKPFADTSDPRFLLQTGTANITLSTSSINGDGEEVLDVILAGPTAKVTLNPQFVLDFLAQVDGQPIKIEFAGEKMPVRFSKDATYQYFLMPIQPKAEKDAKKV